MLNIVHILSYQYSSSYQWILCSFIGGGNMCPENIRPGEYLPRDYSPRRISASRENLPREHAPRRIFASRDHPPTEIIRPGEYVPPEIIRLQRLFAPEHEFLSIRKTLSIAKLTFITTSKYYYFFPVSDFLYFIRNPFGSSRIFPFPFKAGAYSALVGKEDILTHFITILI